MVGGQFLIRGRGDNRVYTVEKKRKAGKRERRIVCLRWGRTLEKSRQKMKRKRGMPPSGVGNPEIKHLT